MSHRLITVIRPVLAGAVSTATWVGRQLARHRLALVLGALALCVMFAGALVPKDAPAAPASTPAVSSPAAPAPATAGQQPAPDERGYQVRPGDTLASIALRHNVDYRRIAADNRLTDPNRIRPGQTLRIGQPTPGVQLIRPGDTLTGLATATGLTVREVRALNPWITNPNRIPAGAGLRVAR